MPELVAYFDRIRERTMRLVACVPPDRVDWTCGKESSPSAT